MNHQDEARLKLDVAVARALLDEIDRSAQPDPSVIAQLVEELNRVAAELSKHAAPVSDVGLRDTA
jgi:hypothetical protein